MLNMIDTQDKLKNFSEGQLIKEMQIPSGSAPQFMVLGEIERRKRMRADAQKQEGLMQPTVAQEAVNGAGVPQQGLAGIAQSLAPQTNMAQNTGVGSVQEPVRMAGGGPLSAGTMSAIAQLKVTQPEIYAQVKDDPEELKFAAEAFLEVAKDPEMTSLEAMSAPREDDLIKRMFSDPSNRSVSKQQAKDAREFGGDYALDQRGLSLGRSRPTDANDPLFAEGAPVEYVGGTSGPTPGGIVGGSMFSAPEAGSPAGEIGTIMLPSTTVGTSPFAIDGTTDFSSDARRDSARRPAAPRMDAAPDVSQLTGEQARRLYLAGREYPESGTPAVVDMFNREREFQQSDTYTPPEQIYDLGPRGRLKYEMDDASPIEKYREFNAVSNRLARERAAMDGVKSEAALDAQNVVADAKRRADAAVDRKIGGDQPAGPNAERDASLLRLFDQSVDAADDIRNVLSRPGVTTGDPLQAGGISELMPPKSAGQIAKDAADIAARAGGGTKTGGGGTGAGSDKKSGIVAAKNGMDQDKWLALAQAGLTLMSTGDFGKAGIAGLGALRQSKADDMSERKLDAELMLRKAQLAAANRKGSGSGGLSANQLLSRGNDLLKSGQAMLENAGDNADAGAEAQAIMSAGRSLIRQAIGGAAPAGPTVTKTPSAT
jgi:hypothetical protein